MMIIITATNRNKCNCVLFFDNSCFTDNIKNEDKPLKLIIEETKHYTPNHFKDKLKSRVKINYFWITKH